MKLLFQLIFFIVALVLTFISIFGWIALIHDATPQGLLQVAPIDNYTDEQNVMAFLVGLVCPILSITIFFMLWKTNFFTRNK